VDMGKFNRGLLEIINKCNSQTPLESRLIK
jgi:hypothetical protein